MSKSVSDRNTKLLAKALHAVIADAVETANKNRAAKDDTKRPSTKDDVRGFATKDDINSILDDSAEREKQLNARLGELDKDMQGQFKKINKRLDRLIEKKRNQSSN